MARRTDDRWHGRPVIAFVIRTLVFLVPIATSVLFAWWLSKVLPSPERGDWVEFISWWVVITAGATVVLWGVDRVARRALPLAALYKFSLVFPDKAPSRYKVARKTGSLRDLDEEVRQAREQGLGGDRTAASETVLRLVAGLSRHDRATRGHSERVRVFTDMLAEELDLDEDARNRLRWAALLHDVGKMAVHADILNKPGKPDEEEWKALKSHPAHGARITAPLHGWLGEWAAAIEEHHEKYDGSGYPHGRAGTDISWGARIVAVADAYDTMTAARAYKRPMAPTAAREELAACAGSHFDPVVVRAFLNLGLGRLRLAAGPLSWLAQTPLLNVPARLGALLPQAAAVATLGAATLALPALPNELPDLPPIAIEEPPAEPSTPSPTEPPVPSPEPTASATEPAATETETADALPVVDPEPTPEPATVAPTPAPPVAPTSEPTAEPTAAPAALIGGYRADPSPGSDVRPGQELTLTLTVVNPDGAETATANVLSVSPIAGAALVPGSATLDGRPLTGPDPLTRLLLPDLAPGASTTVTYAVLVDDVPSGTVLTPVASLTSNRGDLVVAVPGGYTVANDPALTADLVSDAAGPLARGEVVTYTATLRNGAAATGRATGLAVELPTPAGLTYVADSARIDGAVRPGSANPFASPTALSALAPGEEHVVRISFRVPTSAADATPVDAKASFSRSGDADLLVTTSDVVSVVVALTLDAVANPPDGAGVTPGTTIEYVSTVANGSGANTPAKGLVFSAPTPNDATLGPAAPTMTVVDPAAGSTTTTLTGADPLGSLALPDVPVGGSIEIRYEATVDPSVPDGTAVVASSGAAGGDAPGPLAAARSHTVMSAPVLGLGVEPSVPEGDVKPGTAITYTATITNSGDAPATGVAYEHPLPAGASYTPGSAEYALNGGSFTTIPGTANPFETPYALPVDVDVTDTLVVRWSATFPEPVAAGTDLSSTATVTAAEAGAADTQTLTHTALGPDLTVALDAQPTSSSTVIAGTDTVTYSVAVTNGAARGVDATSTVVALPVPTGMRYVSGSAFGPGVPGGAPSNPFASGLDVGTVPADDVTYTYGFTAEVVTPVDDGTRIDSGTTTVDPLEVSAVDAGSVYHLVSSTSAPSAALTLTSAQPVLQPDGSFTIEVDVANGPTATQELSGTISGALPNDAVHDDIGPYPLAAGVPFGPLLPGESTTVTVPMLAAPGTPDGTTIVVEVDVATDQAGTLSESATILVRDPAGLADDLYLKTAQPGVDSDPPLLLPLSPDAPTQTTLPNYTVGEHAAPGHLLDRRGGGQTAVDETDPKEMQHFGLILDGATTLNSEVRLTTWAHVDAVAPADAQLDAVLLDCAPDLSDCLPPAGGQVIATGSVALMPWGGSSTGFVETEIDFGTVYHEFAADRALVVKLSVPNAADEHLVVAYDTTAYPSVLELDLTAQPDVDITTRVLPVAPTAGDRVTVEATISVPVDSGAFATGVTLDVSDPGNATYVPGSAVNTGGPAPADPFAGTWSLPALMAPGDAVTVRYDVDTPASLMPGDTVASTFTVTAGPGPVVESEDATVTIAPSTITFSTLWARANRHGDAPWEAVRPAAPFAPTQAALPNQDTVDPGGTTIDGDPGLLLKKLDIAVPLAAETDVAEYAAWLWAAPYPTTVSGTVRFEVWAQMKDSNTVKAAQLQALLVRCDVGAVAAGAPDDTACTTLASAETPAGPAPWPPLSPSGGFELETLDFGTVSATIAAGEALGVKLGVSPDSDDDVWVASDTTAFPSRITGTFASLEPPLGTTLHLHDDASGDGLSSIVLPMDGTPPTASTPAWAAAPDSVPDFDTDVAPGDLAGADPGTTIADVDGIGVRDPANRQLWQLPIVRDTRLQGPVTVDLWSAVEGFPVTLGDVGRLEVSLLDCTRDGASCTVLATDAQQGTDWHASATWQNGTFVLDGAGFDRTVAAGRTLVLEVATTTYPFRDMLLVYDSVELDATITFGSVSTLSAVAPEPVRLTPWPVELDLAAALLFAGWWAARRREEPGPA